MRSKVVNHIVAEPLPPTYRPRPGEFFYSESDRTLCLMCADGANYQWVDEEGRLLPGAFPLLTAGNCRPVVVEFSLAENNT